MKNNTITAQEVKRRLLTGGNAGEFTSSYAVTKRDNWVARANSKKLVVSRRKSF